MMMNLIGDPKLFVMQVEMDIYSVLKRVSPIQSVMLFTVLHHHGYKKRVFHIHIYKLIKRFHFTFCMIIHYMNEFHTDLSEFWYLKGYQNGSMN